MNQPYTIEELNDGKADENFNKLLALQPKNISLYSPKSGWLTFQIFENRLALINALNLRLNYFHLRHRLPINTKRAMDVAFLIHYVQDHKKDKQKASFAEQLRFFRLWYGKYGKEVNQSAKQPYQKDVSKAEKKFWDLYSKIYWVLYIQLKNDDELDYFHNKIQ